MAVEVKLSEPVDLGGMKFTSITIPDVGFVVDAGRAPPRGGRIGSSARVEERL